MSDQLRRTIFAGCRELGLSTENRQDLQLIATGKESMSDMDDDEMQLVVDALKAKGFKTGFKPGSKGKGRKTAPRGDLRYAHVLWGLLGKAKKLKTPGTAGLNAFVRVQFENKWGSVPIDIDTLQDAGQISDVIRALKAWCTREGIETEKKR